MAYAPLLRMNTAPVLGTPMEVADRMNVLGMATAARASQLSGSTVYSTTNSTASLSSISTASTAVAQPNGQVMATSNIINQRADASRSLYQICISLKQRLAKVPGFEGYMEQLEYMSADPDEGGPVESLWKLLRTGYPLLAIYNALQPDVPLQVQEKEASESKRSKIAILRFVEACKSKLKLPTTEVFIITDLAGNDTTGFVKVGTLDLIPSSCLALRSSSDTLTRSHLLSTMSLISPSSAACSSRSSHTPKMTRCNPARR